MSQRPTNAAEPSPERRGHVEVLRSAAEALRRTAREQPRGPWRWGEPDLGPGEPLPIEVRHNPRWRVHADPLTDPLVEPFLRPAAPVPVRPASPRRTEVADPEVAEALATLLDLTATRLEQNDAVSAEDVELATVAVARCLLGGRSPRMPARRAGPPSPTAP